LKRKLALAHQQQARAATVLDLASLWAERGGRQRATDLLAPIYAAFTEDIALDLIEAKALLDELLR
jgi:hypothetical protein